jgi:enoyl-CoA hydratase
MSPSSVKLVDRGDVWRLELRPMAEVTAAGGEIHRELAEALEAAAAGAPKVVIVTGAGPEFLAAPPDRPEHASAVRSQLGEPDAAWNLMGAVLRVHRTIAEMDSIVVASVNGDAIGFGASVALAADFVVAAEGAVIADHHAALDELRGVDRTFSLVPGDGGAALAPLVLPRGWLAEYLFLGRAFLPAELAAAGVIYRAVPDAEVNGATQELVDRLRRRNRLTLAWTKRVLNRSRVQQLNLALDAGLAYEWLTGLFAGRAGDGS